VQSSGETRKFIYDMTRLLLETDDAGDTERAYTATTDEYGDLVSEYDEGSGASSFHQYDALGSTDALLDADETATDRYQYRAFGLATHESGTSDSPFTFVGKQNYYRDPELELYYLGMGNPSGGGRPYDPTTGQFLAEDPRGTNPSDPNPYAYAANNPVNATDPSGNDQVWKWGGIVYWRVTGSTHWHKIGTYNPSTGDVILQGEFNPVDHKEYGPNPKVSYDRIKESASRSVIAAGEIGSERNGIRGKLLAHLERQRRAREGQSQSKYGALLEAKTRDLHRAQQPGSFSFYSLYMTGSFFASEESVREAEYAAGVTYLTLAPSAHDALKSMGVCPIAPITAYTLEALLGEEALEVAEQIRCGELEVDVPEASGQLVTTTKEALDKSKTYLPLVLALAALYDAQQGDELSPREQAILLGNVVDALFGVAIEEAADEEEAGELRELRKEVQKILPAMGGPAGALSVGIRASKEQVSQMLEGETDLERRALLEKVHKALDDIDRAMLLAAQLKNLKNPVDLQNALREIADVLDEAADELAGGPCLAGPEAELAKVLRGIAKELRKLADDRAKLAAVAIIFLLLGTIREDEERRRQEGETKGQQGQSKEDPSNTEALARELDDIDRRLEEGKKTLTPDEKAALRERRRELQQQFGERPESAGDILDRRQEAVREFQQNTDFRRWWHKNYKADQKFGGGMGSQNPDLGPDQILEGYDEWVRAGRPKPN
jgi:RHS repeat-associated protein